MDVSVIGLGKLGSPLAAVLAGGGHNVIGVDTNSKVVEALNSRVAPVPEPGLQDLLDEAGHLVRGTTDVVAAVAGSALTYVIVPTPSGPDGEFSLDLILPAVQAVGAALRQKEQPHVVAITSTVMPGHTGGPIRVALETASGRQVGQQLGLCYTPEFIALGSVVHDMQNPDVVLIGCDDGWSANVIEAVALSFCKSTPHIASLSLVDAEVAKLAVNTFITTKISYANMLAEICEKLPGADATKVTEAIGHDHRIGPAYLRPATAYGGPCFPRDNVALSALARRLGARADLAEATQGLNRHQIHRLVAKVEAMTAPGEGTVAVLGLSYKPGTPVVEEAAGLLLAEHLARAGYKVVAYDPAGMELAGTSFKGQVDLAPSLEEAVSDADVVVVATPWPQFAHLSAEQLAHDKRMVHVIDCWGVLQADQLGKFVQLSSAGRSQEG